MIAKISREQGLMISKFCFSDYLQFLYFMLVLHKKKKWAAFVCCCCCCCAGLKRSPFFF